MTKDFENAPIPENGDSEGNISGSFTTLSFISLLKIIHLEHRTGVLYLDNNEKRTMIFFEKGNIVGVSSSKPDEQLGNFMVSRGLITDQERIMAAEIAGNTNMPLGRILVTGGKIAESDMQTLLRMKAEQMIWDILQWDEAEFSFHQGITIGRLFVRIQIDPQKFLEDEEDQEKIEDSDTAEMQESAPEQELPPQLVTIVPVDNHNNPILFCEMNVAEADSQFRRVETIKGLSWELRPGDYNVKVFLPTLFLKTMPLHIKEGQNDYRLVVQERNFHAVQTEKQSFDLFSEPTLRSGSVKVERVREIIKPEARKAEPVKPEPAKIEERKTEKRYNQTRVAKRYDVSIPVSLRTSEGRWLSTSCINLSTSGLCVIIVDDPPSSDLYVRLHVPIYTAPIECPGSVCWVKLGRVPKIGVKLYLSDQMKSSLDHWLMNHDRSKP